MNIQEYDEATYICAGNNRQGRSEQEIAVRVEGKAPNNMKWQSLRPGRITDV